MTRILVLSDTHIPRSALDLPEKVYNAIKDADMIIHAGDFVEKDMLDKLKSLKDTKAVYGNMDAQNLQNILNPKEIIQVENIRIGLIHGYGAPNEIIETVKSEFEDVDAIVFGHSHSSLSFVKNGILFFNPGSPTDTVFAAANSYGILEIDGDEVVGKIVKL